MLPGSPRRWYALCLLAVAVAVPLTGCGSGSAEPSSEPQGEEQDAAQAAKQIPEADRVAYYQVATSAGLLRIADVSILKGTPRPLAASDSKLRAAQERVAATRPRDKSLFRARRAVLGLLHYVRSQNLNHEEARWVLRRLHRTHAKLNRFVRKTPGASSLVPD
jgi:hypothetical protein